jgi:opacity protein-like surface antigen
MRLPILAFALAATSLVAQDARIGVQAQANIPMGDLKDIVDSKVGIGAGLHAQFSLGNGMAIRARGDYNTWPDAEFPAVTNKVSNLSLGGDFLYFVDGKDTSGVFFAGGLSAVKWSYETKDPVLGNHSHDTTKLGLALGLGYQFNRSFGTEARYLHSSMGNGLTADSLSLGATLKF